MVFLFSNMKNGFGEITESLFKCVNLNGLWVYFRCRNCTMKRWFYTGYGYFDFTEDFIDYTCDDCGEKMCPVCCCFHYCKYYITGISDRQQITRKRRCSSKFEITSRKTCEWDRLEVVVEPAKYFQVFCKGLDGKTHTLNVSTDLTTDQLHEMIAKKIGFTDMTIARDYMYLVCSGPLQFGKTLEDYGISSEATIHAVGRLR